MQHKAVYLFYINNCPTRCNTKQSIYFILIIMYINNCPTSCNTMQSIYFILIIMYINNCPTRCNTKQSIYYSASSLYMFRVSTTRIIRSTQNCNYNLRYWSYFLWTIINTDQRCTEHNNKTGWATANSHPEPDGLRIHGTKVKFKLQRGQASFVTLGEVAAQKIWRVP